VSIAVRLPTLLRPAAGGERQVEAEGTTIGEVLVHLQTAYPGMAGQVLTDRGELHRFVNVYVNDDDVRYIGKLETKVGDDDVVSILPAVAGGA
jgi:molybdopterin synthase sulfur carrier subunit